MASVVPTRNREQQIKLFGTVNDEIRPDELVSGSCGMNGTGESCCVRDDEIVGLCLNPLEFNPESRLTGGIVVSLKEKVIPPRGELKDTVVRSVCDVDVGFSRGVCDGQEIAFPAVISFIRGRFVFRSAIVPLSTGCVVSTDAFGLVFPVVVGDWICTAAIYSVSPTDNSALYHLLPLLVLLDDL